MRPERKKLMERKNHKPFRCTHTNGGKRQEHAAKNMLITWFQFLIRQHAQSAYGGHTNGAAVLEDFRDLVGPPRAAGALRMIGKTDRPPQHRATVHPRPRLAPSSNKTKRKGRHAGTRCRWSCFESENQRISALEIDTNRTEQEPTEPAGA